MKKILLLATFTLLSLTVLCQRIIENPKFSATTANYLKITKIALYDTATVVSFEVNYPADWGIWVNSSQTYIQDSKDYWINGDEGYIFIRT